MEQIKVIKLCYVFDVSFCYVINDGYCKQAADNIPHNLAVQIIGKLLYFC